MGTLFKGVKRLEKPNVFPYGVKDYIKYRSCGRKRQYATEELANIAANGTFRIYECPFCFSFHITKKV